MDSHSAQHLVRRFYDRLWNDWDDTAVDDTLAAGITFRGSLGQQTSGRDGWRVYRDQIRCGAPDFHNEIVDLVADGNRAAVRLRYSGTHLGPLLGIPATGRVFRYPGAAFFTVAGGLIADVWVLGDLDELRRQISMHEVQTPGFAAEAHRQSAAIAASEHDPDDQAFIDAVSTHWIAGDESAE